MNTVAKRIVTIIVSLFLIGYVSYQAYAVLYDPIRTMRVESGTFEDIISTEGFVVHDETVINQNPQGVIDYTKQDGESVSKGGEVAAVYETEQDAQNERKIQQLNSQIQQYKQMGSASDASTIDVSVLSSEIDKVFLQLSEASDSSKISSIDSQRASLLTLLDKKQLATGEISNFDSEISSLQKQCDVLSSKSQAQTGSISAPAAGYFVSAADGLENLYNTKKIASITSKDVDRLLAAAPAKSANAVGKVITGFQSYIVCKVSNDDVYKLHVGSGVSLRFLLSSESEIPVTVAAINKDASGCAVVLRCDTMSSTLAAIRRQTVEIVDGSYSGIKISDSFIHIVNGTKGVYVRNGDMAQFKKIDQIYSGAGYVVSSNSPSKQDYVQIYDEVIENGDDLYDGKVIK